MPFAMGIDVARYQTTVDWQRVRAAGVSYVFVKATQSTFMDPLFKQHWAGARQAGLLRSAYHFLVQETDGLKQSAAYLKALGDDPGELPPVVDIEDLKMTNPTLYAKISETYLLEIEKQLGRRPIIYTAAWYWTRMAINGKYPAWAPNYPLWVAQYPVRDGFPPLSDLEQGKFKPALPKSWTTWAFWQYSERGRVDGITHNGKPANVDLDVFQSSLDDLRAWAGLGSSNGETPVPLPPVDISLATNVEVINAFAKAFGNEGGALLQATGLMPSVTARLAERYAGPTVANMPNLSDSQKVALNSALAEIIGGG